MLRVLIIAEAANPEWVSVPLIGWSLYQALAKRTHSHLITQVRNRDSLKRFGLIEDVDFSIIDNEKIAAPMWRIGSMLRGKEGLGWTTISALGTLSYYYFESLVWQRFGTAIERHSYDIVHRVTPLSPTTPSILAKRCFRAKVPFIVGPLNGGIPWPKEFSSVRRQEHEWLSYVRWLYRFMPARRSTLRKASAIIVGSRSTFGDIPARFHHKCVYIPENAINPSHFDPEHRAQSSNMRACFVGRMVPYKGPDMLLEAIAPLLRAGHLSLDLIGDGPLMSELRQFVAQQKIETHVTLHGWIAHENIYSIMRRSQLFLFPSIREFGGGAILEAMALGVVPVVINYGGPSELVTSDAGFKIPLGSRSQIITRFRDVVTSLCNDPSQLEPISEACISRVKRLFTWDVKAQQITEIYESVLKGEFTAEKQEDESSALPIKIDHEGLRFMRTEDELR